ncbi:MAG: hypothetical protein V2B19_09950 [Pseudomonadota bacterium]
MDRVLIDEMILRTLRKVTGLVDSRPLPATDYPEILEKEQEAEQRSLMGLGKVVNTGVREILTCQWVYVSLTSMEFDWGCHPSLLLKKGRETVGEEVRDEALLADLRNKTNVWFLHKNFVVYKDRVSFPQDIMKKICHFEIPCLPANFCLLDDGQFQSHGIHLASPSILNDLYLKKKHFGDKNADELGTVLIGIK